MVFKCILKPGRSQKWNSLDHSLQGYRKTHSITAYKFATSRLPSEFPNSLHQGLRVHLQPCPITALKCISKLAQLRPPSSHNHSIEVNSPNPLDHSLQLHLSTCTIMASKFAQSQPSSVYPNSLDHSLQLYLSTHMIMLPKFTPLQPRTAPTHSLDPGVQGHLETHCMTVSQCIFKLAQLWPPNFFVTASRCISILTWLGPQRSRNHGLKVHLHNCSNTTSECISKFSCSRYGETVSIDGRQPSTNTPLHLRWYPTGIHKTEHF